MTDPSIVISGATIGEIPAGSESTATLTATGGTAPYQFHITEVGNNPVPSWLTLEPNGGVIMDPPAKDNESVTLLIYATDAVGRHSPYSGYNNGGPGPAALLITVVDETPITGDVPLPADAARLQWDAYLAGLWCAPDGNCESIGGYEDKSGNSWPMFGRYQDGTWTTERAPLPSDAVTVHQAASLDHVSCIDENSCVATGYYTNTSGEDGLIEVLSQGSWTAMSAPLPPDADSADIDNTTGVSCMTGGCVVAGDYVLADGTTRVPFAATFADGVWSTSQLPLPADPSSDPNAQLQDLSCSGSGTCAAVGSYVSASGWGYGLVETMTNGEWSATSVTSPDAGADEGTMLTKVSCGSDGTCAAFGQDPGSPDGYLVANWDGANWTAEDAPVAAGVIGPGFTDVVCGGSSTCVLLGQYRDSDVGTGSVMDVGVNGTWTPVSVVLPDGALDTNPKLADAWCSDVGTCEVIGSYVDASGASQGLVETVAEGVPSAAQLPAPADANHAFIGPMGVWCGASGQCVTTGQYENVDQNVVTPLGETFDLAPAP
jgi:hypothetical protein